MIKTTTFGFVKDSTIELNLTYRELHIVLWKAIIPPACRHPIRKLNMVSLGTEMATTNALNWKTEGDVVEDPNEVPERICIVLIKGDKRSRWLALHEGVLN